MQAVQLLKRFNNDLDTFINSVVKYNTRFEKVDFSSLHKHLVEMGDLRKMHMKESQSVVSQNYAKSGNAYAERATVVRRKTRQQK